MELQLRFHLPPSELQSTIRLAETHPTTRPVVIPELPFSRPLPSNFQNFIYDYWEQNPSGNHAWSYGVAVDPASDEVIYSLEEF